jgi:glycine cleavage system H protein
MYPADRKYTKDHEWIMVESGSLALVGITQYAQEQLGDVVFVDIIAVGSTVSQGGKLGEIESVKAVSDLFSPVIGEIVEINNQIMDHPELINEDPHGRGWVVRITPKDPLEIDSLMSGEEYMDYLATIG